MARSLAASISLAALLACLPAQAEINASMRGVFDGLGAHASVDGSRYIAAQSRHVFSAGGLSYRTPRDSYRLLSVTPPSLAAGCGGIDLYGGSFSFINKDRFVQMARSIAANSVGLAFKTALCSTSANLCQAVEDLQKTLQGLNQFNIDSCEAAKSIVGGVFGSMQQSSQSSCQSASRSAGLASDASEAREMCATPADFGRARESAASGSESDSQPIEFVGGNLTWQILGEIAPTMDRDERELLMSMLGTHVVTTVSLSLRQHPPTITSIADLHERELTLLRCDEPVECLGVSQAAVTLQASFLDLAAERLDGMAVRIAAGDELTDAQLNLIAGAPVPVLALVQADAAGAAGLAAMAAEAVAYSSAHRYLTLALRRAAGTVSAWRSRSASEAELARSMVEGTRELRTALAAELHAALARTAELLEVNDRAQGLRTRLSRDLLAEIGE